MRRSSPLVNLRLCVLLWILILTPAAFAQRQAARTVARGHYGYPLDHTIAQCQADLDDWNISITPNTTGRAISRDRNVKLILTRELRRRVDEMMECRVRDNPHYNGYSDVVDEYKWELLYRADDLIHEHGLDKEFEETRGSY